MKKITHLFALIGTLAGVLNAQNGFYTTSHNVFQSISSITNTEIDKNGTYWTAYTTNVSGTDDVLKFSGGVFTKYVSPNSSITGNKNNYVVSDTSANLWLCSRNGLEKYDGTSWTTYNITNCGIAGNNVQQMAFDSNGVAWLATLSGISAYNGTNWINYTTSNSNLPSDSIFSVYAESNSSLWFGLNKGLVHFNGTTFSYFQIPAATYAANFKVSGIGKDALGNIWLSSLGYGIQRFQNNAFTPLENLVSPIFNVGSANYYNPLQPGLSAELTTYNIMDRAIMNLVNGQLNQFYLPASLPMSNSHKSFTQTRFYPGTSKLILTCVFTGGTTIAYVSLNTVNYNGLGLGPNEGLSENNFKFLEINHIKTPVMNRGDLHWMPGTGTYETEAPKGSNKNPLFISTLWIGGKDSLNNLHVSGQLFRQTGSDFWPGPLDTTNAVADSLTANKYDKVWKVNVDMIYYFQQAFAAGNVQNGTYTVPDDILSWPAQGSGNHSRTLAPFVDVNGDGLYNPLTGGDYPKIKGDESIYTIYNDQLAYHGESGGGLAFGVEVQYEEYAFYCPLVSDSNQVINNTIYRDYQIINRSSKTYDSVYVGFLEDNDVGNWQDDMCSAIPADNYVLAFNGDNYDEDAAGGSGYHQDNPIISLALLDGPTANYTDGTDNDNNGLIDEPGEKCLLSFCSPSYIFSGPGCPFIPNDPTDLYGLTHAVYPDSTHLQDTVACAQKNAVNFQRTGFPYTWQTQLPARDVNMLLGSGPMRFNAYDTLHFTLAMIFTQDSALPLFSGTTYDSLLFLKNRKENEKVRNWYYQHNYPGCANQFIGTDLKEKTSSFQVFPNPASDNLNLICGPELKGCPYSVFDQAGRLVLSGIIQAEKNSIPVHQLHSGMYFISLSTSQGLVTKKIAHL